MKAGDELLIRCVDDHAGARLILVAAENNPTCIERLHAQYGLRERLNSEWAAVPVALSRYAGRIALVLSDPGGLLLANSLQQCFDVDAFLRMAEVLAAAVGRCHAAGLVHRNLSPCNMLVDFDAGRCWLTGFVAADQDHASEYSAAYNAPEQSGCIDSDIDARTDIYALGCIFHQMLTGLPPVAHGVIAAMHTGRGPQAAPLSTCASCLPTQLAAVVIKMLATRPDERYQSVASLAADLALCRAFWQEERTIPSFPLDLRSIGRHFKNPARLYGRTSELGMLAESFERVAASGKSEFILLTGYSGSGKSALVANLITRLRDVPHHYATGKCDPLKASVPYFALVQACQMLLRSIVGESDDAFAAMRAKLLDTLGVNAGVLAALVPNASIVLGPVPPVPKLTPQLERIRFLRLVAQLLNAFASAQKPLILFLDDLQWADAGTLAVIKHLITDAGVQHVSIVAAYRDTGAQSAATLQWLNETRHHMMVVPTQPLRTNDLAEFISDTLGCTPAHAIPLAKFVESKTCGEPFFAIRLLASLADEGLITFDYQQCRWSWNLWKVLQISQPNNIAEFMRLRIAGLSMPTQQILGYLSCLESASADTLGVAAAAVAEQTQAALIEAQKLDLVYQHADEWRFWHDRVREAVYAAVSDADRQRLHLATGRRLAACAGFDPHSDQLFVVVNQINRGLRLVKTSAEREAFGRLNLAAGQRARDAAEHVSALEYFVAATHLLTHTRNTSDRHAAQFHRAECEFLTGSANVALARLDRLQRNFLDLQLRTNVTRLLLTILTALDQLSDAREVALKYLHQAGQTLPTRPGADDVDREFAKVIALMGGREPRDLLHLPPMRNAQLRSIMDVYVGLYPIALFLDRNLRDFVLLRMTSLSLQHGQCDAATHAYAAAIRAFGARYGNYETGFQFGALAMKLIENKDPDSTKVRAQLTVGASVLPWSKPVAAAQALVREAVQSACSIGDLNFELYSRRNAGSLLIFSGAPIRQALAEADAGFDIARKFKIDLMADTFMTQICMLRELSGMPVDEASLLTAGYDPHWADRITGQVDLARSIAAFAFWTHRMQVSLTFGDFPAALAAEHAARKYAWTSDSFVEIIDYACYSALAHAEALLACSPQIAPEHIVALYDRHNTLAAWARRCPENFGARAALVEAQIACVEGRLSDAEYLFEAAIDDARQHGFMQIEAMAAEAAARHYERRGLSIVARSYVRLARHAYASLGALAKVHAIDSIRKHERAARVAHERPARHGSDRPALEADGAEAANPYARCGEIVLSKLAGTIVTSSIEFAGAQFGVLALYKGGMLQTAAKAHMSRDGVALSMHPTDVSSRDLPATILQTVARTRVHVVLDDALQDSEFAHDPYMLANRPRSVACVPIVQQARTTGILYLENRMAAQVFSGRKIEVLLGLATQAAVTLENAELYARLAEESRQRDRAVDALRDSQKELARVKPLITMRELVGSVVHEVAQPLTSVGTAASAALNWLNAPQPDIGQARSMVEQIIEQSSRGRNIVRGLRALVGNATPSFELFDINACIDETLAPVQNRLSEARVELTVQSSSNELHVYGDRVQLQQVVFNLVVNALDAMTSVADSRRTLTVSTAETSTGEIVVAVEDTGPGIAPSVAGRLFTPFVTTRKEGLGMGLAICSMIVEAHGGELTAQAGAQCGAVFRFSIPKPVECVLGAGCG